MATSAQRAEFVALAHSAAQGIALAVRENATSEVPARLALERLGDLARAQADSPEALKAWAAEVSEDVLASSVRAAELEAQSWNLPESIELPGGDTLGAESVPDLGALGFVLQRRDETASLVLGVTHIMLQRERSPVVLAGWTELLATLRAVDERIAAAIPEVLAQDLLGLRVCLQKTGDWSLRLAKTEALGAPLEQLPPEVSSRALASRATPAPGELATNLDDLDLPAGFGEPDDTIVFDYIQSGALGKYVEGYAATHPDFADDLASTIDALKTEGEWGSALAPRRWRSRYAGEAEAAVDFELPELALAAADSATGGALVKLGLGLLPDLTAEVDAELNLSDGIWTLTLEVGRGELAQVGLNDVVVRAPNPDGSWTVRAPRTGSDVRLRVEDATGIVLEENLRVEPQSS